MNVDRRYSPDPCHSTLGDDFYAVPRVIMIVSQPVVPQRLIASMARTMEPARLVNFRPEFHAVPCTAQINVARRRE